MYPQTYRNTDIYTDIHMRACAAHAPAQLLLLLLDNQAANPSRQLPINSSKSCSY